MKTINQWLELVDSTEICNTHRIELKEYFLLQKGIYGGSQVIEIQNPRISNLIDKYLSCECKTEWLKYTLETNAFPYGDKIQYDECIKCGKKHNFNVL